MGEIINDPDDDGFINAIQAVVDAYDADVYIYSGGIDHAGFGGVIDAYKPNGRQNALLILTTHGGLANSAYKISRFFQSQYDRFDILIPSVCKSAGTLLAIGANRLIMNAFSELGPLDVQLYERDEIGARKSGLLSHSAFEALKNETFDLYEHFMLSIKARSGDNISFPVASDVAGDIASRVMAPIFEQLSPNVLGSDYRDLRVAIEYGNRLARVSGNISDSAVRFLTEHYPSHDFIIDMKEADMLFDKVIAPDPSIWRLMPYVEDTVFSPQEPVIVINLNAMLEETENDSGNTQENQDSSVAASESIDSKRPERKSGKRKTSGESNPPVSDQ